MHKVSIVIPTFKRSHLIEKAVTNCLEQSYENTEIIVVDDNGIESIEQQKTKKNLEHILSNNENIRYIINDQNQGACFARNRGASISKGFYLAFYDDDDRWEIDKVSKQVNLLNENPNYGLTTCCYYLEQDEGKKKYIKVSLPDNDQFQYFIDNLGKNFGMQLTMYRKEVFVNSGSLDNNFPAAQDLDLNLRILKSYKAIFCEEPLVTINVKNPDRISNDYNKKILSYEMILKKHQDCLNFNSRKFLFQRIMYLSFALGNTNKFEVSYNWLRKNEGLSFKYLIYRIVLNHSPSLRKRICNIIGYNYEF